MRRARRTLIAVVIPIALAASSCSSIGGGTYSVDVIFARTTALYPSSRVRVMGADVGRVRSIDIDGKRIRVQLAINKDVPVPADAIAAIVPFTLVGERNVVLTPAWRPGMTKIADGAEIPIERTQIPVEIDETLEALKNLADALDPQVLARLIHKSASSLKGRGKDFNVALEEGAHIVSALGSEDKVFEEAARNLHVLASGLNQREAKLGRVVESFSRVSAVLAKERNNIAAFLDAVARLPREGQLLLANYQKQIPQDIATLARVAMVVESNIGSVEQLLHAFPATSQLLIDSFRPQFRLLTLRATASASSAPILNGLLSPLGFGPVPCVPSPDVACP